MTVPRPARPKALTALIALLDEAGWSYAVGHGRDTGGALFTTVKGAPFWDTYTQVQATWHSRNTGTLRLSSCMARQMYRDWHDVSLKAARALVTPEPEVPGE